MGSIIYFQRLCDFVDLPAGKAGRWHSGFAFTALNHADIFPLNIYPLSPTLVGMKNVSLGPLEQEVMACIWRKKACTARDVVECLTQDRKIAYNTVQTIMTRLVDKGLLRRKLEGKTHLYKPTVQQKNILSSLINQTMGSFTGQFGEEALIAFVDGLDDISEETRQKLIKKLQNK